MGTYLKRMETVVLLLSVILSGVWSAAGPRVAAALEVGDKAPDFTLPSSMGAKLSLSQFRGKKLVLLEFYGADFSPTCAANLSVRKADYSQFEALNVPILGISSNNLFMQKIFADSLRLPYPLLSDFPHLKTIRSYGGLNPNWAMTTAQRAFFLIDTEGIVRGQWRGTVSEVFPTEQILEAARTLSAHDRVGATGVSDKGGAR
jgi:peroxiredoxin Q/BCP